MGGQAGMGGPGGMAGSGGIAGVASTKDMEGIRLYNEKSNYKEWEFLFDRKKAMESAGMGGMQNQNGMGNTPLSPGMGGTSSQTPGTVQGTGSGSFGGMSGGNAAPGGTGSSFGRQN